MKPLDSFLFEQFKTDQKQITDYRLQSAIKKTSKFPALNRVLKERENVQGIFKIHN